MKERTPGRYYRITPRFWQDPDVRNEWTEDMRMLALYLMTSPHRNMVGLYYCPLSYMENDLQWQSKRIRVAFDSLSSPTVGFVRYDPAARVVFLVNGLKYDAPSTANQVTGATKVLKNLPRTPLLKDLLAAAEMRCEWLANGIRLAFDCESNETRIPDSVSGPRIPDPGYRIPDTGVGHRPADPPTPFVPQTPEQVRKLWNEVCGDLLPLAINLPPTRTQRISSRARKSDRDQTWWSSYFLRIRNSPHCCGESKPKREGDTPWKATLDWAVKSEDNVTKVLEGQYGFRPAAPAIQGAPHPNHAPFDQALAAELEAAIAMRHAIWDRERALPEEKGEPK